MSQQNPGFSGPNQQPGQPYPGQSAQPYSGQPGQAYAGQPGQAYPGQPFSAQQPGQPMPGGPNSPYQGPNSPQQPAGKPKKPIWKRWWMICLYVIVVIFLATKIGGGGDDAASNDATAESEVSQAADAGQGATKAAAKATTQAATKKAEPKKAEPKKAGIGTAVKSGDLSFTVTGFKCGVAVSDPMDQLTPQGQFCKLSVTIANGGKDQATVSDSQIKVSDSQGNEYSTSSDTWAVDGSIFLKDINPGNKMSGVAYFDVPKGVTPITGTFKGSLFSRTAEVALS